MQINEPLMGEVIVQQPGDNSVYPFKIKRLWSPSRNFSDTPNTPGFQCINMDFKKTRYLSVR